MAQRIEFEGVVHEFPDDFTPEEISAALSPPESTGPFKSSNAMGPEAYSGPSYGQNNPLPGWGRAAHRAADNTIGALSMAAGAPAELGKQILNAPGHLFNIPAKLLGYEGVGQLVEGPPAGGVEGVKGGLNRLMNLFDPGYAPIAESDKSGRERVVDTVGQTAAAAGLTGAGLAPMAAARVANPNTAPRLGDAFLRTYADKPGRAVMADTFAGAGSGGAVEMVRQHAPEAVAENPLALMTAGLVGGAAGGVAVPAANALANTPQRIKRGITGSGVPYDPKNPLMPITNKDVDDAARGVQSIASDKYAALRAIQDNAADFRANDLPVPTTGLISEDVGLNALEKSGRVRNQVPYIESDNALRRAAQDRVMSARPNVPETELRAPQRYAEGEAAAMRSQADDAAKQAQAKLEAGKTAVTANKEQAVDIAAPIREQAGQGPTASRQLADQTRGALEQRKTQKNALAEGIKGESPVDPIVDTVKSIRESANDLVVGQQLPTEFMKRLETLTPRVERRFTGMPEDAGFKNETVNDKVEIGKLAETRKALPALIEKAAKDTNYTLKGHLQALKTKINEMVDASPDGKPFQDYYRDEYAPYFATGRGREMRDATYKGTLHPENEAAFWLNNTEDSAAHLSRILKIAPNPQAGQAAARNFMVSDLARKVAPDGSINPVALRKWLENNRGKLATPELNPIYNEIEALHRDVVNNRTQRSQLNNEIVKLRQGVEVATANKDAVKRSIDEGALGVFIGRDPSHSVKAVFGSQDPAASAASVNKMIAGAPPAIRGQLQNAWHANVVDEITRRVTDAMRTPEGEIGRVGYAKLTNLLRDNDGVLREVFRGDPDKLRQLNLGRKALEPLLKRAEQATVGSPTAENFANSQAARLLEIGLKSWYGGLAGGNVFRNVKLALKGVIGDNSSQVARLWERAFTEDPRIMEILLKRSFGTPNPGANKPLNRAISAGVASEQEGENEKRRKELRIEIRPDANQR